MLNNEPANLEFIDEINRLEGITTQLKRAHWQRLPYLFSTCSTEIGKRVGWSYGTVRLLVVSHLIEITIIAKETELTYLLPVPTVETCQSQRIPKVSYPKR